MESWKTLGVTEREEGTGFNIKRERIWFSNWIEHNKNKKLEQEVIIFLDVHWRGKNNFTQAAKLHEKMITHLK